MHTTQHQHTTTRRLATALAVATLAATLACDVPGTTPDAAAAPAKVCSTADFTDVQKGSTFYEAITWLRCEGLSVGYANGSYGVGKPITRGETAQLLYRMSGETHEAGSAQDFRDVKPSSSAFTAVSWMKDQGLSTGYSDKSFGVNKPITRGELAAFLYRATDHADFRTPKASPFADVKTTDTFYAPAAWLASTGMVSGYADGTFRTKRTVTRGETAKFLYAAETRTNGASPAYQVPAHPAPTAANPTGGTGGAFTDAIAQSYSNGTVSSSYHAYAGHLSGKEPHGTIVYLHGDGGWEYKDRKYSPTAEYIKVARENNLLLVVPKTPDRDGTWWGKKTSGAYAADLFDHLGARYNLDLNRTYWVGFSGGADVITEQIVQTHSDGWTGGAALILGGGPGEWGYLGEKKPISDTLQSNFTMHWAVGENDRPSHGGSSGDYDAFRAAHDGHDYYKGRGMTTKLTILPNANHVDAAKRGPAKLAEIIARR